jgi:RNA polymerase sigma-70 factor (ECF subfamily)
VSPADREIVERVRRGDPDGFGALVHRYQARVFGLVLMMVRERAAAEDVTQEAFVRAFTRLDQYDASRPFYPWLATIAVRLAQNCLRHRARIAERDEASLSERQEQIVAPAASAGLLAGERRHQVWEAVAALCWAERTVVMLHYRDETSLGDIAQTLGVTTGTVKTLLFRARRHLRERLSANLLRDGEATR